MITPSFGLTATERVLPKLALDFTTASLDGRITFTRTTGASNPATYTNSSGVVTAATNNQPRFDYDPVTLACKGLLIEESRSNLTTYSDDLGNATWTKSATTVNTDAVLSPDGTVNADKLIDTATTAAHFAFPAITVVTAGTTYTGSCYFKAAENTFAQLTFSSGPFGAAQYANFNLSTGVVTAQSGGTATIQNAGNGWYRCTFTAACTTSGTAACLCAMLLSGTAGRLASYAGNASNGLYVWGYQLEAGAFATSYIPTTTAAATRAADVAVMTGTNFSSWYRQDEGTLFVEGDAADGTTSNECFLSLTDGTSNNRIQLRRNSENNYSTFVVMTNGVFQATINSANNTWGALTVGKFACAAKANDFASSFNGTAVSTDPTGTLPVVDQAVIGDGLNSNFLNGHIRRIAYYPIRLSNAELQSITA